MFCSHKIEVELNGDKSPASAIGWNPCISSFKVILLVYAPTVNAFQAWAGLSTQCILLASKYPTCLFSSSRVFPADIKNKVFSSSLYIWLSIDADQEDGLPSLDCSVVVAKQTTLLLSFLLIFKRLTAWSVICPYNSGPFSPVSGRILTDSKSWLIWTFSVLSNNCSILK